QSVAGELAGGGDRRRPRTLVDQGYLAEVVARPECPDLLSAHRHRGLPGVDQEERGAPRTLPYDRLSRSEPAFFEPAGDLDDLGLVELSEQRYAPEGFDRGAWLGARTGVLRT